MFPKRANRGAMRKSYYLYVPTRLQSFVPMKFFLFTLLLCFNAVSSAAIITTIKPLTLIANEVTRGIEQPQQLLADGISAHDYALRPSERLRIQQAELVIWVGTSHETFLRALLKNHRNNLSLESLPTSKRLTWRNLETNLAQANTLDSHLWLSPDNAIALAYAIANARGKQRPNDAANYQKNADIFAKNLRASLQPTQAKFAQLPHRQYVAYHDAYQYLEASFGLQYRGSISISPEQKSGLKHLLSLKKQVQQQQLHCLLTEPQFDKGLADQIFGDTGRYVMVDDSFKRASSYSAGLVQMAEAIYGCVK
jgi:zinc transport system substrate-binding protein